MQYLQCFVVNPSVRRKFPSKIFIFFVLDLVFNNIIPEGYRGKAKQKHSQLFSLNQA
jgi:hypothetical protein